VSEHSEEGPEEQSSKRQLSPELGTLGQDTNKAPVPAPVKERYDPVRASQLEKAFSLMPQESSASNFNILPQEPRRTRPYDPYSTAADNFWDGPADDDYSSRWDVGFDGSAARPVDSVPIYGVFGEPYNFGAPVSSLNAYAPQVPPPMTSASTRAPAPARMLNVSEAADKATATATAKTAEIGNKSKMSIMQLVEDRKQEIEQRLAAPQITISTSCSSESNNKRKADEISVDEDEAMIADDETKELMVILPIKKTPTIVGQTANASAPLRRPIKRARFQKAATEITKYAVGMALGGVGTIAFLCSPLAERMLA